MTIFEQMRCIRKTTTLTPAEKLTLLAILDHKGANCDSWPALSTLAMDCGLTEKTVWRSVQQMEALGFIVITRAHRKSHHYEILVDKLSTIDRQFVHQRGTECPPIMDKMSSQHINEHINEQINEQINNNTVSVCGVFEEPKGNPSIDTGHHIENTTSTPATDEQAGNDDGFEKFWSIYPKKVAKAAALKAWEKIRPDAGLTKNIIQSVEQQAQFDQWQRENGRYVPHASTFLSQQRYLDEIKQTQSADDDYKMTEKQAAAIWNQ